MFWERSIDSYRYFGCQFSAIDNFKSDMKKSGHVKFFDGLNYAGAMLMFLAALGVIAVSTKLSATYPYLMLWVFVLYGAGQFLIVIATVGLTKIRFNVINITTLVSLYTLLSFWDFIAIILWLPSVIISMILGPLTFIVFGLSLRVLGVYFIEDVIGYNIKGVVSFLENPSQAFIAIGVFVISGLILGWQMKGSENEDWVMEKAGDLIFKLRRQLQEMVDAIIQADSR